MKQAKYDVAVVGATGAVGEVMRRVVEERNLPLTSIKFLASERSAGKTVTFRGKTYPVQPIRPEAVGALLLVFGLQWLRKAILRAGGVKAQRDARQAFERELQVARQAGTVQAGLDPYSFTIAFKGVFLEGLEVIFIVLTFGANQHRVGLAAAAAGVAVLLVALAGVAMPMGLGLIVVKEVVTWEMAPGAPGRVAHVFLLLAEAFRSRRGLL